MIVANRNRSPGKCPPRGFTLLEIAMVAVILGIIAWVVIPRLSGNSFDSKSSACYVNKRDIEVQTELWYRNEGSWPAQDLSDIGADPAYFPDGPRQCPVDGTGYVLDGATHRVTGHEHVSP